VHNNTSIPFEKNNKMKKIIGIIGVITIALTMFIANGSDLSSDINLRSLGAVNNANAEVPQFHDPIWNVKVVVGWPATKLECTTGGSDVCFGIMY
jgi:hypothetical protein